MTLSIHEHLHEGADVNWKGQWPISLRLTQLVCGLCYNPWESFQAMI